MYISVLMNKIRIECWLPNFDDLCYFFLFKHRPSWCWGILIIKCSSTSFVGTWTYPTNFFQEIIREKMYITQILFLHFSYSFFRKWSTAPIFPQGGYMCWVFLCCLLDITGIIIIMQNVHVESMHGIMQTSCNRPCALIVAIAPSDL